MKRPTLLAVAALLAVAPMLALAVTDGEVDGNGHPHVVLLVMDVDGQPTFRCSATMLSPNVILTAGHCTNNFPGSPFTGMRIFTESDVDQGTIDGTNSYPTCDIGAGTTCFEADSWAAHPDYETGPFFLHDVGVVTLPGPGYDSGVFGVLPAENILDSLKTRRGHKDTTFTAVGYGLQRINPVFVESARVRMYSEPKLIQINTPGFTGDFSLLLSNNHSTGGTCFGDSGGPNFWEGNVVGGVTSFGINGNCAGTGGVFRVDREDVLEFVWSFL